jgi:hypothetical protein
MLRILSLVAKLDDFQWRTLSQHLNSRSFQFDIIGNLPVELLAEILPYFSEIEFIQLAGICRKWRQKFFSHDLLRIACTTYFPGEPLDHSDLYQALIQRAERRFRFQQGLPTIKKYTYWQLGGFGLSYNFAKADSQDQFCPGAFLYRDGRVAFFLKISLGTWKESRAIRQDVNDCITVYDISTDMLRDYQTKNRERLRRDVVALTDTVVASLTCSGYFYVWKLDTDYNVRLKIPTLRSLLSAGTVQAYYAGRKRGAISHGRGPFICLAFTSHILFWNWKLDQSRELPYSSDFDLVDVMIHPFHEAVVLFGFQETCFTMIYLSFTGEETRRIQLDPERTPQALGENTIVRLDIHPMNFNGQYSINFGNFTQPDRPWFWTWDARKDHLRPNPIPHDQCFKEVALTMANTHGTENIDAFWWNDTIIYANHPGKAMSLNRYFIRHVQHSERQLKFARENCIFTDVAQEHCHDLDLDKLVSLPSFESQYLAGNESHIVLASSGGIFILDFAKPCNLPEPKLLSESWR